MAMTRTDTAGDVLRDWHRRRRLSQMDLAGEAEVSTRHLSFIESGRAAPSREMLLRLVQDAHQALSGITGLLDYGSPSRTISVRGLVALQQLVQTRYGSCLLLPPNFWSRLYVR